MKFLFALKNSLFLLIPFVVLSQNNLDTLSYKELRIAFFKDYSQDDNQLEYAKYYFEKAKKEEEDYRNQRDFEEKKIKLKI